MSKLKTLTTGAGVVTTLDLNYLPQAIGFVAATQLTGIKIEVLGVGVVMDLDANGITAHGRATLIGYPTNSYVLDLADGKILNKVVTMTFTNSAAQTPDIFGFGDKEGTGIIQVTRGKVFAGTQATFEGFGMLYLPSLAANDKVTVEFDNGLSEIFEREDLQFASGYIQNYPQYQVNNLKGNINRVIVQAASDQSVYIAKYISA